MSDSSIPQVGDVVRIGRSGSAHVDLSAFGAEPVLRSYRNGDYCRVIGVERLPAPRGLTISLLTPRGAAVQFDEDDMDSDGDYPFRAVPREELARGYTSAGAAGGACASCARELPRGCRGNHESVGVEFHLCPVVPAAIPFDARTGGAALPTVQRVRELMHGHLGQAMVARAEDMENNGASDDSDDGDFDALFAVLNFDEHRAQVIDMAADAASRALVEAHAAV